MIAKVEQQIPSECYQKNLVYKHHTYEWRLIDEPLPALFCLEKDK